MWLAHPLAALVAVLAAEPAAAPTLRLPSGVRGAAGRPRAHRRSGRRPVPGNGPVRCGAGGAHRRGLAPRRGAGDREGDGRRAERRGPLRAEGGFLGLAAGAARRRPALRPLVVAFSGAFDRVRSRGLYAVAEGDDWYAYTFFEPTDARRAFPCFDEPGAKIPWRLTLRVKPGDVALANAPVASERPRPGGAEADRASPSRGRCPPTWWPSSSGRSTSSTAATGGHGTRRPSASSCRRGAARETRYAVEVTPRDPRRSGGRRSGCPTPTRSATWRWCRASGGPWSTPGSWRSASRSTLDPARRGDRVSARNATPTSPSTSWRTTGTATSSPWPGGTTSGSTSRSRTWEDAQRSPNDSSLPGARWLPRAGGGAPRRSPPTSCRRPSGCASRWCRATTSRGPSTVPSPTTRARRSSPCSSGSSARTASGRVRRDPPPRAGRPDGHRRGLPRDARRRVGPGRWPPRSAASWRSRACRCSAPRTSASGPRPRWSGGRSGSSPAGCATRPRRGACRSASRAGPARREATVCSPRDAAEGRDPTCRSARTGSGPTPAGPATTSRPSRRRNRPSSSPG